MKNDMQYTFATVLLDQLQDYGTNVNEHGRRLRTIQYPVKTQIEAKPSLEIQSVYVLAYILPLRNYSYYSYNSNR